LAVVIAQVLHRLRAQSRKRPFTRRLRILVTSPVWLSIAAVVGAIYAAKTFAEEFAEIWDQAAKVWKDNNVY
jgi:hypothetical protein